MFFLLSVFHKIFYKTILRKLLRRTTLIQYIGVGGLLLGRDVLIGLGVFWGFWGFSTTSQKRKQQQTTQPPKKTLVR